MWKLLSAQNFTQAGGWGRERVLSAGRRSAEDAEVSRSRAGDVSVNSCPALFPSKVTQASSISYSSCFPWLDLSLQEGRGLSRRGAIIWAFGETRCLFTHEKDLWLQHCCIFICWGKTLGFKQSSAASGEPGRKLHLYFRTLRNVVIQQKTLFSLSQKRITPPCLLWPFYVTQY